MDRQFARTTLIIVFSVAVVLGVAFSAAIPFVSGGLVLVAILFTLPVLRKRGLVTLVCLLLLGLAVGSWRGTMVSRRLAPFNDLYGHRVILITTAQNDAVYGTKNQLSFDGGEIRLLEPVAIDVPGKIKVEGFGVNSAYRGDVVQVEGKLQDTIGSKQGRVSFATVSVLGRSSSPVEMIRHKFIAGMQSSLPEPQASFGLGLLIGEKSTLPKASSDSLAAVGLTHIIAVSGYNLTIIVMAVRRLLAKRSKYQTTLISISLIVSFLLLTGFSASIVRAAIVSMLSILAWYYGRTIRPMLLIAFTAAITAVWNPLYVWGDAGWYLSFLAFYGVLVLAPMIVLRLSKQPRGVISMLIAESLCAQVMTAPYILFTFKQLSLVALPANLLVVPLVPLAMLLSLIAGLAGMLAAMISGWLAWPARIILTYMLDIASLFARVPHAVVQRTLPLMGLLILYGVILLVSAILGHKLAPRATITDIKSENLL